MIPISLGITVHHHKHEDQVRVQDWKKEPLKSVWRGSYSVVLTTPPALKVTGKLLGFITSESIFVVQPIAQESGKKPSIWMHIPELQLTLQRWKQWSQSPALATPEAGQSVNGWSLRNQQDQWTMDALALNWTGAPSIYLSQNNILLYVSLRVDYHLKAYSALFISSYSLFFCGLLLL